MERLHQHIQLYKRYNRILGQGFCLSTANLLATNINVQAQIIPDRITGITTNSIVNTLGTNVQITGGTQTGVNLFHSFVQFSLDGSAITTADFINPGVTNIISRVTGGTISHLNGTISAGNANLFLINPNGIIFGPQGKLENVGSFIGTTADSLKFQDGNEFSAKNPGPPLLTMNVPVGLQFGATPGAIIVEGIGQTQGFALTSFDNSLNPLQVSEGQTLALIGGNIQLNGGLLQGPGGKVELAGVGGGGQITLNPDFSLNLPDGVPRGDISLINSAAVNALNAVTGDGGSINIQGQNILLAGRSLLTTGVAGDLGLFDGKAGDIALNSTGTITLDSSRIENNVNPGAAGNGGNIVIAANSLALTNSTLDVSLYGGGSAGNILIRVLGGFSLDNSQLISNVTGGNGKAGGIYILANGPINILTSQISSDAFSDGVFGDAGFVGILSNDTVTISNSEITTETNGLSDISNQFIKELAEITSQEEGEIAIAARSIVLSNSNLSASSENGGYAGQIKLFGEEKVEINDSNIASDALSADFQSGGYSGFIGIASDNLVSINNSTITAESFGDSSSDGVSSGQIDISGREISITNDSNLSTSISNDGIAGFIYIAAAERLSLANSRIQSNSESRNPDRLGDAGDIAVNASLADLKSSKIEASSPSGNGGIITFIVNDLVVLRDGTLLATNAGSQANPGNGGSIIIDPKFVIGVNNSDITANSFNGAGGFISITATEGIFGLEVRDELTAFNDITAISQTNPQLNGDIEVNSPDIDPSTGLTTLAANFVDVTGLVAQDICQPKGQKSSLTITGRGGLPPNPYEIIAPDTSAIEWANTESPTQPSTDILPLQNLNPNQQSPTKTKQIIEAQGWTIAADGTVILTANPAAVTPHGSGFTSPGCR